MQSVPNPENPQPATIDVEVTVKCTPKPDQFELYNVTDDPMELDNKYNKAHYSSQQAALAKLFREQCAQKRLTPCSGDVPGQPLCSQRSCRK